MPFSRRVNVIDNDFVRVKPDIYQPESPYDAHVSSYDVYDVYEGELFDVYVRDVMVDGQPPPSIEIIPDDPESASIAVIRGNQVSGTAPQISIFGRNYISLTVKADN